MKRYAIFAMYLLLVLSVICTTGCSKVQEDPDQDIPQQVTEKEDSNNQTAVSSNSQDTPAQDFDILSSGSNEDETDTEDSGTEDAGNSDADASLEGDRSEPETLQNAEPENAKTENSPVAEKQIRLNVPEAVQETGWWCGPASLQMVLFYHGLNYSQSELAEMLNTSSVTGTEYEDLARVATELIFTRTGKSGKYQEVIFTPADNDYREAFEQRVIDDLESGDPVFASINNAQMYHDVPDQVHQVVVYGIDMDAAGQIETYYYLDPSYTRTSDYGQKYTASADEMWNAMLNNPEPGYVY